MATERHKPKPKKTEAGSAESADATVLDMLKGTLGSGVRVLQLEACAALLLFAHEHKVAMCQAELVGPLITLSQTTDREVSTASGKVLRLLA